MINRGREWDWMNNLENKNMDNKNGGYQEMCLLVRMVEDGQVNILQQVKLL